MRSKENLIVLISFFIIANFLGLFAASNLIAAGEVSQTPVLNEGAGSAFTFFTVVLIAAGLMLLLYKLKADLIIKAWFLVAIFSTIMIFFSTFIPDLFAIIIALSLVGASRYYKKWQLMNAVLMFGFAGAGAFFGVMVGFIPALIILALLAVYDVIAVFFSKHMISLAKSGLSSGTFMGFIYPKGDQKNVQLDHEKVKEMPDDKVKSKVGVLGGGDVIIPMMFAISLIESFGFMFSALSVLFSALFLYFLLVKAQEGKFYPALPFVNTGALLGFVVAYLFSLI